MQVLVPKDCAALHQLQAKLKQSNARTIEGGFDNYSEYFTWSVYIDVSTDTCEQAVQYCDSKIHEEGSDCTECQMGGNSQGSPAEISSDNDGTESYDSEILDECDAVCEADMTQCMAEEGYSSADYMYQYDVGNADCL